MNRMLLVCVFVLCTAPLASAGVLDYRTEIDTLTTEVCRAWLYGNENELEATFKSLVEKEILQASVDPSYIKHSYIGRLGKFKKASLRQKGFGVFLLRLKDKGVDLDPGVLFKKYQWSSGF